MQSPARRAGYTGKLLLIHVLHLTEPFRASVTAQQKVCLEAVSSCDAYTWKVSRGLVAVSGLPDTVRSF